MVFYASRSFYDELLSAGVKIYERQHALLHAKTALSVWSTIGSTNLDWRSSFNNQEINAVILRAGFRCADAGNVREGPEIVQISYARSVAEAVNRRPHQGKGGAFVGTLIVSRPHTLAEPGLLQ